jgi:hypothetical protein
MKYFKLKKFSINSKLDDKNQLFEYSKSTQIKSSRLCLDIKVHISNDAVLFNHCKNNKKSQKWRYDKKVKNYPISNFKRSINIYTHFNNILDFSTN